jgi:hypothetical protein
MTTVSPQPAETPAGLALEDLQPTLLGDLDELVSAVDLLDGTDVEALDLDLIDEARGHLYEALWALEAAA